MPTIIPLQQGDPRYQFSTDIGEETYVFRVRWNSRDAAWYFDVLERDETPIVFGVKVVLGVPLGASTIHKLFTGGVFVARDVGSAAAPADPAFDDLGSRVELWYLTRDEMAAESLGAA